MNPGDEQRRRLESQRARLQETWDLINGKLKDLQKAFAIETSAAIKFQLEQQIHEASTALTKLDSALERIEQSLSSSHSFLQQVTNNQILKRQSSDVLDVGKSAEELLEAQNQLVQETEQFPTEVLDSFNPQLDQKFPKEFAIVYVEEKDDRYLVRAYNSEQRPLYTDASEPPALSFDQQMKKRKPAEIRGIVREFSAKNLEAKKIRGWLTKLRKQLQESFGHDLGYVVIHDRTDHEIPWEMLNLSEKEHLGSSIITVRWQDIQCLDDWDNEDFAPLEIEMNDCQGDIVAYANTKDFKGVKDEVSLLNQYNALCIENIQEFLQQLHQIQSPVSLIFMASHGFLSEEVFDSAIGEQNPKQRISFSEFCGWDFDFLKTHRSIIFMNACHSGRLRRERQYTNQRMGLATFFLERGARGVIGTMGEIQDQYAPRIAQTFLAEYQKAPHLSVAAVLRKLREQVLQNLQTNPSEENWSMFLFTFMYVYYGNPMTVLRLTPSGGQANV